jgi:hypothetical protein
MDYRGRRQVFVQNLEERRLFLLLDKTKRIIDTALQQTRVKQLKVMNHREFFDQNVPARLQRALTKSILENCKEASRFCFRHFAAPQAKDLSGDFRRAKIEDEFAGIAGLFKAVSVSVKQFENNTGYYNELAIGEVKLTQSCISEPDFVPRTARFRSTLARDGQRSFAWNDLEDVSAEEPSFLYTILAYGIDVLSPKRSWPAFIKVQFPNQDCTRYVCEGIDLFQRFPDLVSEYVPKPSFERQITKRRRRKAAGE